MNNISSTTIIKENKKAFSKDVNYNKYVQSENAISNFDRHLTQFLIDYFQKDDYKPLEYKFTMFIFAGEDYMEPMIKILYPDNDHFDILKIRDDLEENLKKYLVKVSSDLNEFKQFRKIMRKFRILIRRD